MNEEIIIKTRELCGECHDLIKRLIKEDRKWKALFQGKWARLMDHNNGLSVNIIFDKRKVAFSQIAELDIKEISLSCLSYVLTGHYTIIALNSAGEIISPPGLVDEEIMAGTDISEMIEFLYEKLSIFKDIDDVSISKSIKEWI